MIPIKAFRVQPNGRWRVCFWRKGAKERSRDVVDWSDEASATARMEEFSRAGAEHCSAAPLYLLPDGSETTSCSLPPGSLYDWSWMHDKCPMPDGIFLCCVLPNKHHWLVDGRASNCGSPCMVCGVRYREHTDDAGHRYVDSVPAHRCWIRHGDPRTGNVHVDKNGLTCDAGAGSIQSGEWHGFLHNGMLHL